LLSGWRNMVEFEGFPFTRLDYLCRLNQARWLDAVEDLPLPEMQYQALMSRFEDEPECIISSLEVADCVFDGGGGWNRKAVAIHTLRIAEAYVDALYTSRARAVGEEGGRGGKSASLSEDESLRELVDGEISRWLERMFATLVARNDGRTLAVELAAHFLVKYLRLLDETRGPKIVHLTERCFDIAIRTLISSGVTPEFAVAQGKRHVAWENELARYGCAFRAHGLHFVLVGMQIIDETTSGHGPFGNQMPGKAVAPLSPSFRMLWEPMIELLVQGDQMPSLLLTGSHFKGRQAACHQLGRVLGSLEEPVNGLEQAWRALQGKRTEAIERRNDRSDADAAPKFLVLIGIGAVSALIESKRDYPYHKFERLWNVLLKSTQSMILMQVFDFSLPWKGIYAYAIALLGIQYPAGDPILDQAVSFVSNDHELLRSVKAMLEANGWDSSAVSELLARNGVA